MKKVLALALALVMILPIIACNGTTPATSTPGTTTSPVTTLPSKTEAKTEEELDLPTPVTPGTYKLIHLASGNQIKSNAQAKIDANGDFPYVSVDWIVVRGEQFYRIGVFGVQDLKENDTDVVHKNVEVINDVALTAIKDGTEITTKPAQLSGNELSWRVVDNGDGTFCLVPRLKKTLYLTCKDGKFVVVTKNEGDDMTDVKFAFEKVTNEENPFYKEFVSEKGNIIVRVPADVYESKNYDMYQTASKLPKKFIPTAETLQAYADRTQHVYETYVDLTDFRPYWNIIVHAYNYQGVMAGVVGNNNNVFVNCGPGQWFYSDLSKMQYRKDEMGRDDYNFMVCHEMGHMFDWDRGWTFESECQADLKAAYLVTHTENGYAAPAEYSAKECFHDDIGTGGFRGLSGGKMKLNMSDKNRKGYSIYRFAEILTEYFQGEVGWESLYKTFHWFQSSEAKNVPASSESWARFELFLAKLSEFSNKPGIDIEADLYKNNKAEMECMEVYFQKPTEADATK